MVTVTVMYPREQGASFEGARQVETDDDPERFKEQLKKLMRHKPVDAKKD